MEIQNFIMEHYAILLLIVGLAFLFSGIAPIVSKDYYLKNYDTKWNKMFWPFSDENRHFYDRYIWQLKPILFGIAFTSFALYNIFNSSSQLNIDISLDSSTLNYILNRYSYFFLLIGIFLSYVGLSPSLPDKFSKNTIEKIWNHESWPFNKNDNKQKRYVKQTLFVLIGLLLMFIGAYNV